MKISSENINEFCRTCLAELNNLNAPNAGDIHHIDEEEHLVGWIEICTALTVKENDNLPQFLCKICYDKLQSFNEFRDLTVRSCRVVRDILETEDHLKQDNTKEWDHNTLLQFEVVKDEHSIVDNMENVSPLRTEHLFEFNTNNEMVPTTKIEYLVSEENNIKLDIRNSSQSSETDVSTIYDSCDADIENCDEQTKCTGEERQITQGKRVIKKLSHRASNERNEPEAVTRKKFEQKFQCEQCPRRCISEDNLEAHKRTHLGLKPFQCEHCDRSFNRSSRLAAHIRELHGEGQLKIVCDYEGCGKVFRRDGSYKMHYRMKHTGWKPELKTWICEDCGRTFKNHTRLKEHRYKHTPIEEYPYKCESCGKSYTTLRNYKEHLLRHSGVKNFECDYCGMKKATRNELRTHMNYHTKEKQWPCSHCSSVFNSSANLGMHDRIVHKGIRRYACRFCDQSFGKPDTLKHHEMRHTGERPHACELCNKRFIQVVALRAHMKTHEKNGNLQKRTEVDPASSAKC